MLQTLASARMEEEVGLSFSLVGLMKIEEGKKANSSLLTRLKTECV
jgi:hypothetical protein